MPSITPLDYADRENQPPPRFSMHWGGWVFLIFGALSAATAGVIEWLRNRGW